MQPKEGRLAWVCAYVLSKDTERPALAHEMMKRIPDAKNAVSLIDNYAYGAAGASTPRSCDQVKNQEAVETFGLRDLEKSLAPPLRLARAVPPEPRRRTSSAAEEVKASSGTSRRGGLARAPPLRRQRRTIDVRGEARVGNEGRTAARGDDGEPAALAIAQQRGHRRRLMLGPAILVLVVFFFAPLWYVFAYSTGLRYVRARPRRWRS